MTFNSNDFTLVTLRERPDMHHKFWSQAGDVWPEFMLHNKQAQEAGVYLISVFDEFQIYLLDKNTDEPVAFGQTIPCRWDGTLHDIPSGWMGAVNRGILGYKQLLSANTLVALQIAVLGQYQKRGLSQQVVLAMKDMAIKHDYSYLIVPVRPLLKPQYPLIPMEEFMAWQDDNQNPFDPWIKLHWLCGAEILKVASNSFEVKGSIEEWEKWTGLEFPASGDYVVQGGLSPVKIDKQLNTGIYREPNVWMHHPIKRPYLIRNKPFQNDIPLSSSTENSNDLLVLTERFTQQATATPDKIAVIDQNEQLTYEQLNQQANRLAHYLQQNGVKPGQLIGISIAPSVAMTVAVFGILKAGGAFVPLDPGYPIGRLAWMIQDSQIGLIVTATATAPKLGGQNAELVFLDTLPADAPTTPPPAAPGPNQLACCLYTSGSTGQPKGVLIEHHALTRHCLGIAGAYEYSQLDRGLLFASLNYVAALEQLFLPLLIGASLVIREPDLWTSASFPVKIRDYGISVVDLPPGYWHTLLTDWQNTPELLENLPLRLIILGGDETRPETVKLWQQTSLRTRRLLNAYGMTETPVTCALFEISKDGDYPRVPIGKPAPNWRIDLLDSHLQAVAAGTEGEICIGGDSLARGYLNQPELTAEKFVRHPKTQERLYRTGDLGRFLADGNLEYRGRLDHQVQIRGFRVELGEIEQTLLTHPKVQEAAVIAFGEDTEKQLVAYAVCPKEASIWQVQGSYRDEPGVIIDTTERLEFKLKQVNIQSFKGHETTLAKPAMDEALVQNYLSRQSYRQFAQQPIPLDALSHLLSCLMQLKLPDAPIPKYRYPSALGLYPVQTYVQIKPERVEGMAGGFYYYHPQEHRLQLIAEHQELSDDVYGDYNQAITRQAAFSLLLVAHLEAIKPLYGQKLAEKFCIAEAGYMGQLLMTEAPNWQLGLCPLGDLAEFPKSIQVHQALGLSDEQRVVQSFLGGAIEQSQTKTWLQETSHQQTPAELKAGLKTYLQEKLPAHMVPEQYVLCEQLPKTPNGKVDRLALAGMNNWDDVNSPQPYVAPNTVTEQHIAKIWQELFKVERVSVNDEFFALGGNSLLALNLLSKIRQQFQLSLSLQTLLTHNTVESLAKQLELLSPAVRTVADDEQQAYDEGIL